MSFVLRERILICCCCCCCCYCYCCDIFAQVISGHHWFRKWLGVRSAPIKPLPGIISQFKDNWFQTQWYFTIKRHETSILSLKYNLFANKQENKYYKNTTTTQSVSEPLSEPLMVRCVLKVPKSKHDTFGTRVFAVCGPLSWNLGYAMKFSEAFKRTLKTHRSIC